MADGPIFLGGMARETLVHKEPELLLGGMARETLLLGDPSGLPDEVDIALRVWVGDKWLRPAEQIHSHDPDGSLAQLTNDTPALDDRGWQWLDWT